MPKITFDPNNPASAISSLREFLTETQSVYQGMIDTAPAALKSQVRSLKDKVDAALTSLASKPTDQVPAALDAAATFCHVNYMIASMQEMINSSMEALNKLVADYTPKANALQSLQGRIEKNELVEATEVEKRVTEAADSARKSERDRQKLLATRRTVLAKADCPLPLEDEVLDGDDKAFEAVQTQASTRTKKLKDLGLLSQLNAEQSSDLIYGTEKDFNRAVSLAEKIERKVEAEPMLGGKNQPEAKGRRMAF